MLRQTLSPLKSEIEREKVDKKRAKNKQTNHFKPVFANPMSPLGLQCQNYNNLQIFFHCSGDSPR